MLVTWVAFLGYAGALGWMVIWFFHSWGSTLRQVCDGLVYGLVTGAIFGCPAHDQRALDFAR